MQRRHFTKAEAEAKIGTEVRALIDFDQMPAGATGFVAAAMPTGEHYDLGIEWHLTGGTLGRPARSWVTRMEYERFLEEV